VTTGRYLRLRLSRTRRCLRDQAGRGLAVVAVAGLLGIGIAATVTPVLAWSVSGFTSSTQSCVSASVPTSCGSGSASSSAKPGDYVSDSQTVSFSEPDFKPGYLPPSDWEFALYPANTKTCPTSAVGDLQLPSGYVFESGTFETTSSKGADPDTVSSTQASPGYYQLVASDANSSYYWIARYYDTVDRITIFSPCSSEPLTVGAVLATPSLTTSLSSGSVSAGGSVTDRATLSDASSGANGKIMISSYSGSGGSVCSGTAVASETASPTTNGDGTYTATFSSLSAGDYEFQASFAGDSNDSAATSACGSEPLAVTTSKTALSTKLSASTVSAGGSVTDAATLTGASSGAGGTITISAYSGSSSSVCTGTPIVTETASPSTDGDGTYSATFTSLGAGDYEFRASYAGDSNNAAAQSTCGTEPLTVKSPAGSVLAASVTTPTTGADMFGTGLVGAIAMFLGGMLLVAGRRVLRFRAR
jgi:hypothetical protein